VNKKKIQKCYGLNDDKLENNGSWMEISLRKLLDQLAVQSGALKSPAKRVKTLLKLF
jgi:hypothetical protein